ncbi:MAG TPA: hypothetical protein VMU05_25895 [Dongiaceae bacterium]|nr:hypothetical protein [Dongiaceae bacterium]
MTSSDVITQLVMFVHDGKGLQIVFVEQLGHFILGGLFVSEHQRFLRARESSG